MKIADYWFGRECRTNAFIVPYAFSKYGSHAVAGKLPACMGYQSRAVSRIIAEVNTIETP
jgi:hypothetical protein